MRGQFTGKPNRRVRRVSSLGFFRAGDRIQVPTKIRHRRGFPTQNAINNRNHHDLANVMPTSENADLLGNLRIPAGEVEMAWRLFSSERK
jgi:hypothetical protein